MPRLATHPPILLLASSFLLASFLALPALTQAEEPATEVRAVHARGGIYLLMGRGGNIGVCLGADGPFLVDDQYAPATQAIRSAIAALPRAGEAESVEPRFVINTHWHGDHTGGNENFAEGSAIIVAHENVRRRLSEDTFSAFLNRSVPAAPHPALPVVTFPTEISFHWNGEEIHVFHVAAAHTDGDAIVHFRTSNVLHMGDTYFNGFYPFIDTSTGGRLTGMIAAAERGLALADEATVILPGHGPISNRSELKAYRDMLATMKGRLEALLGQGKSVEEIVAAKPSASFDPVWGDGFLTPSVWVRFATQSLAAEVEK